MYWGFLGGSLVKNPPTSSGDTGDLGSVPRSGRSLGEGNGYPLQYPCLENLMDRGAWWAATHSFTESGMIEQLTFTYLYYRGGNEDNGDLLQIFPCTHCYTQCPQVPPTLQQATTNPRLCWRLLDTHRQAWVSLLWGHCSFLLSAGAQGSDAPSKSLFPSPV